MKKLLLGLVMLAALGCADSQVLLAEHLAIININPSHGAVGIGYDTDVTVTFSEVLHAGTVNSSAICLTTSADPPADPAAPCAGTTVAAQVTYDASTLSARLEPSDPLLPDETYTIHVTTAVEADNGTLPVPVGARFTTIPTL